MEESEYEKIELTEAQQEMANAILELKKSFKEPVRKKGPLGRSTRRGPSVKLRPELHVPGNGAAGGTSQENGPKGAYRLDFDSLWI